MTRLIGFLSGLLLVVALAVAAVRYAPEEFFAGNVADEPVDQGDDDARAVATEDEPVALSDSTPAPLQSLPRVDDAPPAAANTGGGVDDRGAATPVTREAASSADGADDAADVADARPAQQEPESIGSAAVGDQGLAPARDPASHPEPASPDTAPDPAPRQWHAFWQPFHSEISAEGFRRRLEGVTGLDYRVVSPRPGEYQVAFAYRDEAERLAHLAAIEAATGLVLRSRML